MMLRSVVFDRSIISAILGQVEGADAVMRSNDDGYTINIWRNPDSLCTCLNQVVGEA